MPLDLPAMASFTSAVISISALESLDDPHDLNQLGPSDHKLSSVPAASIDICLENGEVSAAAATEPGQIIAAITGAGDAERPVA